MNQVIEYDYLFKVLFIGNSNVGKSSLILRFTDKTFTESYICTIGVDFKIYTIKLNNKIIKIQIWDSSGSERFKTITSSYYRNANGIFITFDLTDKTSFLQVKSWLCEIERFAPENIIINLIGNKVDLENKREVLFEEAKEYANIINATYFETSAKLGINIKDIFINIVKEILEHKKIEPEKESLLIKETVKLKKINDNKIKCCN
jgi:Ras-related protein Rab-1A